jgi:hypothetical protein
MGADKFRKEVNEPCLQAAIDRGEREISGPKADRVNTRNPKNFDGLSGYGRLIMFVLQNSTVIAESIL